MEKNTESKPSVPEKCAKCGACTVVCPVYRASGNDIYSARGKNHLAEIYDADDRGPAFEDIYAKCLLCGACSDICPRDLDITEKVIDARSKFSPFYGEHGYQKYLAKKALNRPEMLGAARVLGKKAADILFGRLPAASGLRLRLAMFAKDMEIEVEKLDNVQVPRKFKQTGGALMYFPGCAAQYLYPEITDDVEKLLDQTGCDLETPKGLGCCGLATMASGDMENGRRMAMENIEILEQSDSPILVSCGSCYAHLTHYPDLFEEDENWATRARLVSERLVEVSRFISQLQEEEGEEVLQSKASINVYYHDPCHMRNDVKITQEPRKLLESTGTINLLELPDGPQCCGQGGLFHLGAPELSAKIRDDLAGKIVALKPDIITTTCSGCLMQLKSAMAAVDSRVPVLHLATVVKMCQEKVS